MAKINKELFGQTALLIQENQEKEADALKEYQKLFNQVTELSRSDYLFTVYDNATGRTVPRDTAAADKKMLKLILEQTKSIIAEEMKHQRMLTMLYEALTGFKAEETK